MKNTVNLKNIYTEQLTKLQQKHQHECELLEDLRLFTKQRSIIEKEYAQSLSKLAQQYLTKRTPIPPPSLASQDGNKEQKTMHEVWQTLLEETDKVGKIRQVAADVYSQQISDSCKLVRSVKVQVAKKVFENLVDIQKDLTGSIQELTKLQKIYKEEEHVTHDARVKANDAEDKVKKKSVGLFTSMTKLQQQSAKLNARRDTCEVKSTASRNEYLLSLSAVNAHLNRYYTKDAPELIKSMDGEIYEKMQEYLTSFCQAELQSCGITQECFMRILADSTKVNRDFQLRGFLQDNSIFTDLVQYQFQPQDNDPTSKVSTDHQNLSLMEAETRKCASKYVLEDRALRQANKKLQKLIDQVSPCNKGQDQPPESSPSVTDPHVKIEEMKQVARKAGIEKTKAEARLESLRKAGINVDVYIAAARSETRTPEDEEEPGLISTGTVTHINSSGDSGQSFININSNQKSEDVSSHSTFEDSPALSRDANANDYNKMDDVETTWNNSSQQQQHQQYSEVTPVQTVEQPIQQPPQQQQQQQQHVAEVDEVGKPCMALYNFQASASNELDISEFEVLESLGEAVDGWIRARNSSGKSGLVPATYIMLNTEGINSSTPNYNDTEVMTTTTTTSSNHHNGDVYPTTTTTTQGTQENQTSEDVEIPPENLPQTYSNSDYEVQAAFTKAPSLPTSEGMWARAMYDYYATCDEELSFPEGQLIKVLNKELHDGVDDGWWEGEYNGKVGVFPSLVVEELDNEGKCLDSPQRPGPPEFSPPPPEPTVPQSPPSDLPLPPQQPPQQQPQQPTNDHPSPPTPPPPFDPDSDNPQLEITIPTPEGGKATSELLQAHSLAFKVSQSMRL